MKYSKKLNEAVIKREEGNLKESRKLFEEILKEVKSLLKKDDSLKLKHFYTTCMGEYIIQCRLESKNLSHKALELGKELLRYDQTNKIRNPSSVRSVSNTLMDIGLYEQAIPYLKKLIELYKSDPVKRADTTSHLASCLTHTGKIDEAEKILNGAIKDLEEHLPKNSTDKSYTHLVAALMLKARISNLRNRKGEAISCAKRASKVAKEANLATRIKQTKFLMDFLEGK